jgi:RimJ/RimL family protein N-acetyltransferase
MLESGVLIKLRDWQLSDVDVYRHWQQPGAEWQKYDAPYEPAPVPAEIDETITRLTYAIEHNRWPSPRRRVVIADVDTDQLLGDVSWYWYSEATNWLRIGITLYDPAHWGRGIGYEALGLWCDYLWRSFPQIVRIDLATWSGNEGMMRLAAKLGFQEEARYRKARIVDGVYYDSLGYGILREEWNEQFPEGFSRSLNG